MDEEAPNEAEQERRRAAVLARPDLIEQWSRTGQLPTIPEPDEELNQEEK